ncbi:MAG: hypothetical protein HY508_09030 [Acidobacteria bacterium]|nr:hypothetical protein [Acidobacteriota bacterium]
MVLPFSLTRRLERGKSRGKLHQHLARRLALLFLLGLVHNRLLDFKFPELRIPGVLQRIAVCYFVARFIVMNVGKRGQSFAAVAILVGYWAIDALIPAPDLARA